MMLNVGDLVRVVGRHPLAPSGPRRVVSVVYPWNEDGTQSEMASLEGSPGIFWPAGALLPAADAPPVVNTPQPVTPAVAPDHWFSKIEVN